MKSVQIIFLFIYCFLLLVSCEELEKQIAQNKPATSSRQVVELPLPYPLSPKDDSVIDDYFGVKVADPYRWLESDADSLTSNWISAQNQLSFQYIDQIPYRDQIEQRLVQLWDYERMGVPRSHGSYLYYSKNDGLQPQSVWYRRHSVSGEEEVVLDPNRLDQDGTTAIGKCAFSRNGRYLAFEKIEAGSDWRTIHVLDLDSGRLLPDELDWVKFSNIAWHGNGFFYSRFPAEEKEAGAMGRHEFQQVYYHRLRTDQSADEVVFADRRHPFRAFRASTDAQERYLVLSHWESTSGNALYFKDLAQANSSFIPIVENMDSEFEFVGALGDNLLIKTNYRAAKNRLVSISTQRPEESFWEELIGESNNTLQEVALSSSNLYAVYIQDATHRLKVFSRDGQYIRDVELPEPGQIREIYANANQQSIYYNFTSFLRPATIYRLNSDQLQASVFHQPKHPFNSDAYETRQVWYASYDGTRIPMFVTHRKGLEMNGQHPTLLYGYGGFNVSLLPRFNSTRLGLAAIFLENDGIFAVPNIRGGGEFGQEWHQAGMLKKKQNVFNDFQAAAEHLIGQGYTSAKKLAIYGRSNGGLLVGTSLVQRPDLYAVALPAVGLMDMLRYHKFTIGRAWASEYGISEREEDFDFLYQYSPLHNIRPGRYPATLITTADHDDRVVPAHSYKFAAALQANQQADDPILIRIASRAGHGSGKSVRQSIEEAADMLSFTFWHLDEKPVYQ